MQQNVSLCSYELDFYFGRCPLSVSLLHTVLVPIVKSNPHSVFLKHAMIGKINDSRPLWVCCGTLVFRERGSGVLWKIIQFHLNNPETII